MGTPKTNHFELIKVFQNFTSDEKFKSGEKHFTCLVDETNSVEHPEETLIRIFGNNDDCIFLNKLLEVSKSNKIQCEDGIFECVNILPCSQEFAKENSNLYNNTIHGLRICVFIRREIGSKGDLNWKTTSTVPVDQIVFEEPSDELKKHISLTTAKSPLSANVTIKSKFSKIVLAFALQAIKVASDNARLFQVRQTKQNSGSLSIDSTSSQWNDEIVRIIHQTLTTEAKNVDEGREYPEEAMTRARKRVFDLNKPFLIEFGVTSWLSAIASRKMK